MKIFCQNCGHDCHCNGNCLQNYGQNEKTVCCTHCRHKEEEENHTSNEDLFNGA